MAEKENINVRALTAVGVVCVILLAAVIVQMTAWFYRAEDRERTSKQTASSNPTWADLRLEQEQRIRAYRWIDRQEQIVSIPIQRAMELTARRVLEARRAAEQETVDE